MSNAEATTTWTIAAKDRSSAALDKLHTKVGRLHGSMAGLGKGVSALGGKMLALSRIGILALLTAITAVVGAIGATAKAAAGEQAGLARLDASIKANVKNRKEALRVADSQIKSGMALGFSDDDLRDSFARLLPVTKSATLAAKAQNAAMDVARLKGISLTSASDLVSKALMGNVKGLKSLGIVVPKHATKLQILAAIQKKAKDQAAAYGKTAQGAMDSFGVAVGNLMQDVGKDFLPLMAKVFTWLRTDALPVVGKIIQGFKDWLGANKPLIDDIGRFVSGVLTTMVDFVTTKVIPALTGSGGSDKGLIGTFTDIGRTIVDYVVPKVMGFIGALTGPGGIIESVQNVVGPILTGLIPAFGKIVEALFGSAGGKGDGKGGRVKATSGLIGAVGSLAGVLWGDGKGVLAMALTAIGAALQIFAGIVSGVIGLVTTLVEQLAKMAGTWQGQGGTPALARDTSTLAQNWANSYLPPSLVHKAAGGWVGLHGPEVALVGEKGPEYVVPNHQLRGGGGSPVAINVQVDGRTLARIVDQNLFYRAQRRPT